MLSVKSLKFFSENCHRASAQLVAASKGQSVGTIETLLKTGHRLFGENRVQEAEVKWPALKQKYPNCMLHLIGTLQTNKVKQALKIFDCIQSLDRLSLAQSLKIEMERLERPIPLMVQVNLGNEPQKNGVPLDQVSDFIQHCIQILNLPIIGLMGIPPRIGNPTPYFKSLVTIADKHNLKEKSIGMSSDYQQALECGSTMIRIGTALFGDRG